jgi:hypothetical protein
VAENVLGTIFSRADALKRQLYDMIRNPSDYASMVGGRTQENMAAAQALQNQAFSDPQNPLRITNPQALNQLTQMITSGPLGFAPAGITAFHGSPYLFRQFDPAKISSGEGAQAYGVGAGYTSEGRPVAESYRASVAAQKQRSGENMGEVTIGGKPINWDKPEEVAAFELARHAGNRKAAADFHARTFLGGEDNPAVKLLRSDKELPKADMPGYLYKGDIPDEILPKFLDWDKPLSQQSNDVLNALKRRIVDVRPQDKFDMGGNARLRDNRMGQIDKTSSNPWLMETTSESGTKFFGLSQKDVDRMFGSKDAKDLTGEQIYARLTQEKGSQQAASEYLDSIGIRGIRYLDQGSRGEGKGTSNFIPFRAEDYKIQEINDTPIEDYIAKGLL